ncbi:MAG: hypothetical protein RIQ89_1294 [Bacteroidota bacterium]
MKIIYYVNHLEQSAGGIRQYALGILRSIVNLKQHHFYIYGNANDVELIQIACANDNVTLISNEPGLVERFYFALWRAISFFQRRIFPELKIPIVNHINSKVNRLKIDILHCPYQYTPESDCKTICTMHDVQELLFPEYFTPEERSLRAVSYADYIKRAHTVVTSYDFIKNDLMKFFRLPHSKVAVCLMDMGAIWSKEEVELFEKLDTSANGEGEFILYAANTWPHKNHVNLLKAIRQLKDEGKVVKLICTGHQTPYYNEVIFPLINSLKLEDQVKFLGLVPRKKLLEFYKFCRLVVVPTKYEAGSFPLMEAVSLGVPVICSAVTSLPSVLRFNSYMFNPNDVGEIAIKLNHFLSNPQALESNAKDSKESGKLIYDNKAGAVMNSIYQSMVSG